MVRAIKFERVWNKFKTAEVGSLITTIRHARKHTYWEAQRGKYTTIIVRGSRWGAGIIKEVKLVKLGDLDDRLLRLNTEPHWSRGHVYNLLKRYYKETFNDSSYVTLLWIEISEIRGVWRK